MVVASIIHISPKYNNRQLNLPVTLTGNVDLSKVKGSSNNRQLNLPVTLTGNVDLSKVNGFSIVSSTSLLKAVGLNFLPWETKTSN